MGWLWRQGLVYIGEQLAAGVKIYPQWSHNEEKPNAAKTRGL
jgi:hypothetical protein